MCLFPEFRRTFQNTTSYPTDPTSEAVREPHSFIFSQVSLIVLRDESEAFFMYVSLPLTAFGVAKKDV